MYVFRKCLQCSQINIFEYIQKSSFFIKYCFSSTHSCYYFVFLFPIVLMTVPEYVDSFNCSSRICFLVDEFPLQYYCPYKNLGLFSVYFHIQPMKYRAFLIYFKRIFCFQLSSLCHQRNSVCFVFVYLHQICKRINLKTLSSPKRNIENNRHSRAICTQIATFGIWSDSLRRSSGFLRL